MIFFEKATLRLKQQLGVTQDKEVAEALGLSPRAWAGRKKSGRWPEKEFLALAARRPDLGLDLDYILTGHRSSEFESITRKADSKPLIGQEERMAGIFAQLTPDSQKEVLSIATRLRELEMMLKSK